MENKKPVLLIFLFCLMAAGGVCDQIKRGITVIAPKKDKVFLTSENLPIVWKPIGVFGKLAIILRSSDGSVSIRLKSDMPATGSTTYIHPLHKITPGQYFVVVKQMGSTIKGKSGIFWIRKPPQKPPEIRTIIVTKPEEGDSFLWHEDGIYICWESAGLSGDVLVSLHRTDKTWFKIMCYDCQVEKGDYYINERKIPSSCAGYSYFIMVKHKETGIYGKSEIFKITL